MVIRHRLQPGKKRSPPLMPIAAAAPAGYFVGTRAFSSSNQFNTT